MHKLPEDLQSAVCKKIGYDKETLLRFSSSDLGKRIAESARSGPEPTPASPKDQQDLTSSQEHVMPK